VLSVSAESKGRVAAFGACVVGFGCWWGERGRREILGSAVLAGVHVGAVIGVVRGWFSWAGVDGLCVAPRWGEL